LSIRALEKSCRATPTTPTPTVPSVTIIEIDGIARSYQADKKDAGDFVSLIGKKIKKIFVMK